MDIQKLTDSFSKLSGTKKITQDEYDNFCECVNTGIVIGYVSDDVKAFLKEEHDDKSKAILDTFKMVAKENYIIRFGGEE